MLAALSMLVVLSPQTADSEILFKRSRLNCSEWALAANYYIGLGEVQAVAELRDKSTTNSKANLRVGLICRIIYEPKGKGALRQPAFGDLALPYLTMPLSKWPEYPMVKENGIWFLLDENYRPSSGKAELARKYIEYCQQEGRFRAEKVAIPTKEEAYDAYKSLTGSKRWRDIGWSDSARGIDYTYDRSWTDEILKAQTRLGF